MATPLRSRPAVIPLYRTYVYKTVGDHHLYVDVYLDNNLDKSSQYQLATFFSGGGWCKNNRTDYPRPLFYELLAHRYVVCSPGYFSVPETSFPDILTCFKDFGVWITTKLPEELNKDGIKVDSSSLVATGFSAGGHYALLTPMLWNDNPPKAILALSTPTDLNEIYSSISGNSSELDCIEEILTKATDFENPPSEFPLPRTEAENENPRRTMFIQAFENRHLLEMGFEGLTLYKDKDGKKLRGWPRKGCVRREKINEINPAYICKVNTFPPVYMIMGKGDELFDYNIHMYEFRKLLKNRCEAIAVDGANHTSMLFSEVGGMVHLEQIKPAVEFLSGYST